MEENRSIKKLSYLLNSNAGSLIKKVSVSGFTLLSVFIFTIDTFYSQDSLSKKKPLTVSGYVETYFCYDLANPESHERPAFVYNYNRHNEVNINLAYVKLNYTSDNIRSNITLMGGTYPQSDPTSRPGFRARLPFSGRPTIIMRRSKHRSSEKIW